MITQFPKGLCAASIFALMTLTSLNAHAGDIVRPTGDGSWYYAIGGGDPFMYYNQSNKTTFNLSASADWNMFRGCSFDPRINIAETFSDIEHNVYGLANDVLGAATATFSAWGLSKIQENWPGLYDTLTKGLKDAKESYTVALKTCRDVKADLRAGRDPVEGWISVSRKSSWDRASLNGDNPVEQEQNIEENSGNQGITFVGGVKRGGLNQDPIKIVEDTVGAGYSHLAGGAGVADDDPITGDPNITRVFPNTNSAVTWAREVVGEREVRTCKTCQKLRTRVGQGLRFQYRKEREVVSTALQDVLGKPVNYKVTDAELTSLSVPSMGVVINDLTIENLKNAPLDERQILANKLVGEIALARVMEKALITRDLFNAGAQEPNISASGDVALNEIEYSRARLQAEIDNILFETEVRQKVTNNAAGTIALRGASRKTDPSAVEYLRQRKRDPVVIDGAIVDE